MVCNLCPRSCGVDRAIKPGFCGAGALPQIARAALHYWEEPEISGKNGSGAIFFSGCNLDCVFCQNHEINHTMVGREWDAESLSDLMLHLQQKGAHNINLVTPTPHVDTIIPAVRLAREKGLLIPIVYNTNGYETIETLQALRGTVDIFLPDLKYVTPLVSKKYSNAQNYFDFASKALQEMHTQCGELCTDENGIAKRGMIVRHLVLPGSVDETRRVMQFLADTLPKTVHISLMGQYIPCHKADFVPLNRKLLKREYDRAIDFCLQLGFENIRIQSLSSAEAEYVPLFDGSIEP